MTLVNPVPWLQRAQREHFALGAFNANTLEQVQAIVAAAEAERAPVILQVSQRALAYVGDGDVSLGLRYMARIGTLSAASVAVPVGLHLDHAAQEQVFQAMELGFTSVMFDGGDLPFDENVRIARRLQEQAHRLEIGIEAEVGRVPRNELTRRPTCVLTDPEEAAEFARATGVDSLAVAIGSVHAVKEKRVQLDLARLQAIRDQVSVPLVLHGSSGVVDDCLAQGIRLGLCKVNIATQLNQAFTHAARDELSRHPDEVDPRKYLHAARVAVTERVRERIRFLGAAGKAS